jgi:hypothetical protein
VPPGVKARRVNAVICFCKPAEPTQVHWHKLCNEQR